MPRAAPVNTGAALTYAGYALKYCALNEGALFA